jgi:glycosyltransferase involved in cell wall biosynthesis
MLGLVVPVYNEELRWRSSYFNEIAALDKVKLLFVNDGSQDGTISLIKQISEEFINVSYLDLENNSGKAEALRLGLLKLTSQPEIKLIGFLDADGAFAASDISRILKLMYF